MTNSQIIDYAEPLPGRPSLLRRFFAADLARGVWAMGDQGIVSIGNFATNILLVRNLIKADFGAFGLVLEIILFLNSLQAALIVYPMSLHGAKMDTSAFRRFASGCLLLTSIFAAPLAIVALGVGGKLGGSVWVGILAGSAMALWQIQEMLRRGLIAQMRYASVIWGDAVSYLGQAGLLFFYTKSLHREFASVPVSPYVTAYSPKLHLGIVFAIMGLTSAAAALIQVIQIGYEHPRFADLKNLARQCWIDGRWALAGALSTLITATSFNWTLGLSHGLEAVASWTLLSTVLKLSNPIMSSISGLVMPAVSRAHAHAGAKAAVRKAMKFSAIGVALLSPYYFVLLAFPTFAIKFFAGKNSAYATHNMAIGLRLLVCCYIGLFASYVMGAVLNGLGQSRLGFHTQAANAVVTIVIALPLIVWLGLIGALLGGLISTLVAAIMSAVLLVRYVRLDSATTRPLR